ncbi:TonB-dependent receptor [candidate division KSB1 bacterium]|nr:TonB-dependent receptor [candidate division KSB1 bacterium]
MIRRILKAAALFIVFAVGFGLTLVPVAFAGTTGKVSGRVVDAQNRSPLPGANVIIEGTTMGAVADENGYYTILLVPPGTYNVVGKIIGYKDVRITGVVVRVDLTSKADFRLEATVIAGEPVTVVAERPLVLPDLTASSRRIDAKEIEDIPGVNTVTEAVQLMPGVVGEGENLHVRGGRSGEVMYVVDGVAVNDALFNNQIVSVNKYSVEEVELLTGGYNAEYGNSQSGIVNIVTRTGGPDYTGRLAYYNDHLFGSGRYPSDILAVNPLEVRSRDYMMVDGPGIRSNSFNADRLEFSLGGPEPITNSLLPALGLRALQSRVTFFLSGTADRTDGYLPNENQSAELASYPENFTRTNEIQEAGEAPSVTFDLNSKRVLKHPFVREFLGIDWGGRFSNNFDYSGRLNYKISNTINAGLSYTGSQFWQDSYNHLNYKWLQDHTSQTEGRNYNVVLNWNHTLSPKSFYQVRIGALKNFRYAYPGVRNALRLTPEFMNNRLDDGLIGGGTPRQYTAEELEPIDSADERAGLRDPRSGFDKTRYDGVWARHTTLTYTAKVDYLTQFTRNHEIKVGFELKYNDLHQEQISDGDNKVPSRRLDPPDNGPFITSGSIRDIYDRFPLTGSAYVQDKIEFQSLIMNVGLRYDRFDPGAQVFETGEAFFTDDTEKTPVNTKDYLSPRIGLSHPITARSQMYFFYGRFIQMPSLRDLYIRQNRFRVFQNQLNIFGNADLEAEETVSYEIGFNQQLSDDIKFGVTGFFKDIRNQINTEVFGPDAAPFRKLINRDFGQDRGFEFDLTKRFSNYTAGTLTYTLMWATTRASTVNRTAATGGIAYPNLQEVPANWDQRHTINANVRFEIPAGKGPRLFGQPLDRASLTVFWRYGSGQPFTLDEDAPGGANAGINSARFPYFSEVDLRFRKDFSLVSDLFASFYLDVNNLFNRRNVIFLRNEADHRCLECQITDPNDPNNIVLKSFKNGNPEGNGTPLDLDPQQFGPPRQIFLGFGIRF